MGGNNEATTWCELGKEGGMLQLGKKELVQGGWGVPSWNVHKPLYNVGEAYEMLWTWVDVGNCTLQPCM